MSACPRKNIYELVLARSCTNEHDSHVPIKRRRQSKDHKRKQDDAKVSRQTRLMVKFESCKRRNIRL